MGKLLDKVIAEASRRSEDEQEAFAAAMLAELESDRRWDDLSRARRIFSRRWRKERVRSIARV
jgi:hypothetical protein